MVIHVQGKTDVGCVRTENEDSIDWWFFGAHNTLCCALADGMGGYEGGALASQLAISAIRAAMTSQSLSDQPEFDVIQEKLNTAGSQANAAILSMRSAEPRLNKMGTTLVVALVHQQTMCVMHAGDSRCYLFRDGTLSQLTRDDSVVQQMIDNGSISEDDRERTPYRNVLVKAVGVEDDLEYSSSQTSLHDGDQVMLCSDGLFNTLSHDVIATHLSAHAPTADKVDNMISKSIDMGAPDNVSIILFSVND